MIRGREGTSELSESGYPEAQSHPPSMIVHEVEQKIDEI